LIYHTIAIVSLPQYIRIFGVWSWRIFERFEGIHLTV
jgi:hypothetical protein